jgi:hypothetical protein
MIFSPSIIRSLMLLTLSTTTTAFAENIDSTAANYGWSNPGIIAPSLDEGRAYIAEGATMTIVDLSAAASTGTMSEIAQIPVDATIRALVEDTNARWVYVAGGSFGLLKVDIGPGNSGSCSLQQMGVAAGCYRVSTVDDWNHDTGGNTDRWVFSTALMEHSTRDLLLATFASEGNNELRVYDLDQARFSRRAIRPFLTVNLPAFSRDRNGEPVYGVAYDMAVDGTQVYIAMGKQGVVRVDLTDLRRPRKVRGPVLDDTGEIEFGGPATVRQVAVAGETLLGAANGAGLLQVDLSLSFNRFVAYTTTPLPDPTDASAPTYAHRIDAIDSETGSWMAAVSTGVNPLQIAEGAPYDASGTLDYRIQPGGDIGSFDRGTDDAIHVITPHAGGLLTSTAATDGESYSVAIGDAWGAPRMYVGSRATTEARFVSAGLPVFAERTDSNRVGKHAPRVGSAIVDQNLIFTSSDSLSAEQAGYLETCEDGLITPIPGTEGSGNMGVITNFEAQWFDDSALLESGGELDAQWMVHGTFTEWRLRHLTVGDVCAGDVPTTQLWKIIPPADDYGVSGRLSMMATLNDRFDDDIVLLSRFGTRHGLLAYSRSELVAAAGLLSEGEDLGVDPIATFETHPEMSTWVPPVGMTPSEIGQFWGGSVQGFGTDVAKVRDDDRAIGWVALTAAGHHAHDPALGAAVPDGSMYTHAMVAVHDVTDISASSSVAPITMLYGPSPESSASAVQTVKARGRTWAVVTDLGGAVHIFDITDVRKSGHSAPLVVTWDTPVSPLDGTNEVAVDVEIQRETSPGEPTRIYAYISLFRGGVAVLDISSPADPIHIDTLDTPGLAEGLFFDRKDGTARLLVADREGGVRVMRAR